MILTLNYDGSDISMLAKLVDILLGRKNGVLFQKVVTLNSIFSVEVRNRKVWCV